MLNKFIITLNGQFYNFTVWNHLDMETINLTSKSSNINRRIKTM